MSQTGAAAGPGAPRPWTGPSSTPSTSPGTGPAAGSASPPTPPAPWLSLGALFLSLVGFLGIALLLYEYKFRGVTDSLGGFPTRVLLVMFLALAAAPFFVTIFRRVPIPYLVLPVILIVSIYPLFSPYGLPYSRDPVFNFQVSQAMLNLHSWSPNQGVTSQALTYSYYPGGAIFDALVARLTGLTLLQTFNWSYVLLRLLIIPLAIYALTVRLLSARAAPLAVLLYISVPSIELGVPTQQDFAVIWFLLAVTLLAFLVKANPSDSLFLRIMLVVVSAMVVISHHVSTYFLVAFLLGMAVIPWILKRRDPYPNLRAPFAFLRTAALVLVWVALVTLPVLQKQSTIFLANANLLFHPGAQSAVATVVPGTSYPAYQLLWIGFAIAISVLAAIIVMIEKYRDDDAAFVTFALITAFVIAVVSIPFVSTGFNFLALREFEFIGVIIAPVTAWFIVERVAYGHLFPATALRRPAAPPVPVRPRSRRAWTVALAGLLVLIVITGGYLVPLSTRDQFASAPQGVLIDSAVYIDHNVYQAQSWAASYVSRDHAMWGDYLVYSVFGGFGAFKTVYDPYPMFNGTTFNANTISRLAVGDLIVTDVYETQPHLEPVFPGPVYDQPTGGFVPAANLAKFNNPSEFAIIYQDSIFTVYQCTAIPAVGSS